jgi:CBS domain-containing protein
VSHETVYQTLFIRTRGALGRELLSHLRRAGSVRRSQAAKGQRAGPGQIRDTSRFESAHRRPRTVPFPLTERGGLLTGASSASRVSTEAETLDPYSSQSRDVDRPDAGRQRDEESTAMPDRPSYASQLEHLRVRDCMHAGVLTCSADTPLVEIAGIMTKHRVHAVAVIDATRRPIAVASALDVVAAAIDEHERMTARVAMAGTEPLITISTDAAMDRAAKLMTKHRVHHLIVVEPADGHPVGILSTLDIAGLVAGSRER